MNSRGEVQGISKDGKNLPLDLIKKELLSRTIIVFREFLHLVLVWRFYRTYQPEEKTSSLRRAFRALDSQIKNVWENLEGCNLLESKIKDISFDNQEQRFNFFEKIIKINNGIDNILNQIGFLQKKISYTLEAFPSYYPTPNIFRARQELNVYKSLENMAKEYVDWFVENIFELEGHNINIDTTVYWETDTANEFLHYPIIKSKNVGKEEKTIIFSFKGSFYMVNQNSLWIILAHEAFHFLIRWCEENNENNNFLRWFKKYYQCFLETMVALKEHMNIKLPDLQWIKTLFEDTVCDSFLTFAFGEPYFMAIWRLVFGFDEDERHYRVSQWWIRLRTSLHVLEKYVLRKNSLGFREFLTSVHEALPGKYFMHRCVIEEKISSILKDYMFSMIGNKKKKLKKLAKTKRFELMKKLSDRFKEINIEEIDKLNEGRIWSKAYRYNFDKKIISEDQNIPVILLRFIKVRFDGYSDNSRDSFIEFIKKLPKASLKNNNCFLFYHIGAFFLLYINCDYRDKGFEIEDWKDTIDKLINSLIGNKGNDSETEVPYISQRDIAKKLLCYKEDIAANAICFLSRENGQLQTSKNVLKEEILKFFEKSYNTVLMLIQVKVEKDLNEKELLNKIKSVFDKISSCEEILISFTSTWADWVFLVKLKVEASYEEIIQIKKMIHAEKSFQRTKTDILAGMHANVEIPAPEILIRLSGESHEDKDRINHIRSLIGSNWDIYLLPGILDLALRYKYKKISTTTLKVTVYKLIENNKPFVSDIQFRFYLPLPSN